MDAGHHFVPLVVISKPAEKKKEIQIFPLLFSIAVKMLLICNFILFFFYLFRTTLTIPVGRISRDLPQNLFFHRWSARYRIKQLIKLKETDPDEKQYKEKSPTLPEGEVVGFCMTGRDGWMVANLEKNGIQSRRFQRAPAAVDSWNVRGLPHPHF